MTKRREESDGRDVPEGRRKAVPTSLPARGGKATTASEQTSQLSLLPETADSPQGAVPGTRMGQPRNQDRYAVPKSGSASGTDSSPSQSSSSWPGIAAGGNADVGLRGLSPVNADVPKSRM